MRSIKINVSLSFGEFECKLKKIEENKWIGYLEDFTDQDSKIEIIGENSPIIVVGKKLYGKENEIELQFLNQIMNLKIDKDKEEGAGFENTEEQNEDENQILRPYDPELIRVEQKNFSVAYVFEMLKGGDIDLAPEFQRNFVWDDITRKSRLIESLLLRIPIPVFYFSQDEEGHFKVVDGVQRLTTIKSFLSNEFKLKNLEYLSDCDGCYFNKLSTKVKNLDDKYIRRIKQTQLVFNIIDPQTPPNVQFDIFKRINTGGKSLNPQEMRNCFAKQKIRDFLKELSTSYEFLDATGSSIKPLRMEDQELLLRYLGFYYMMIMNDETLIYKSNMKSFLDETLIKLNKEHDYNLNKMKLDFTKSMRLSKHLFGDYSFRKCKTEHINVNSKRQLINKSLFMTISILLTSYNHEDISKRVEEGALIIPFAKEIDNNVEYMDVLTNGTNDNKRLNYSFYVASKIINQTLGGRAKWITLR
ncbi:MAG: hypothetical protein K0R71_596 [Bacillales bacterium]|jgi:hypothetical protein|nr:hypothetical protein [Bacillales bacterium]